MNALLLLAALPAAPVTYVKLPPGFSAHLYSDQALANDIYTMTIDDAGRVFVAGRGYVRQLIDDNEDGTADRAVNVVTGLKDGPMGLLVEGDSIYVVADGGLKRYSLSGGRQPPVVLYAVKTAGEHEAHGVRRGPDGWLYLMCGNMSGVKKEHLDPVRSPVKDPIAGSLLRISPDGKTIEAVADGFRNAYDFDFNLDGEPFTFDSDNERCVGLPWYEPCRFYHIVPGGNYGWRSPQLSQTWRKPPYFADVVPPVGVTGRGSPTGVVCYRNTLFPNAYRGNFFIADWTFGKVWFVPLVKKHSTYAGKPEPFLEAVGESGFAPTALAVHPKTGELFVSIGGRGTRGAVYRITHDRGGPAAVLPMAERSLEWNEADGKRWLTEAVGGDAMTRRHALDMMLRWRDKLGWGQFLGDAVKPNLSHDDALLRAAAGRFAVQAAAPAGIPSDDRAKLALALAAVDRDAPHSFHAAMQVLESPKAADEEKLVALRVLQLALGDLSDPKLNGTVWEGYSLQRPVPDGVRNRFQALHSETRVLHNVELDHEWLRTCAAMELSEGFASFAALRLKPANTVQQDVSVLAVLGRTNAWNGRRVAEALVDLDAKARIKKIRTDRNWALRVGEIAEGLHAQVPRISGHVLDSASFGEIDNAGIISAIGITHAEAAREFLKKGTHWTPSKVSMLGSLPMAEIRTDLKLLWNQGGFEDSIIPILAKEAWSSDGPKFIIGLRSSNLNVVKLSAAALLKIEPQKDSADVLAAIVALRKLPDDKAAAGPREALVSLLKDRTGQNHASAAAWAAWFAKAHPEHAAKLNAADGFDPAAWKKREANIPWLSGDAERGRGVFIKATCAACHDGGGAIGPSLAGVGKRFNRDDLLTSILQPSRDVAGRYRPTRIATKDEKVHIGMIVYEAVSGVILQTGVDAVVRIAGDQIESQKLLDTSLMPAGLLEKLSDPEIADMITYLRSG